MALQIGATPVLYGKEAAKFLARIHEEVEKPVALTPTPKLAKAQELIKQYAERLKS